MTEKVLYFKDLVLIKAVLGAWQVLYISLLVMNRLDYTELLF